nr:hypothetical protein [Tanacetum cinerariifolium]
MGSGAAWCIGPWENVFVGPVGEGVCEEVVGCSWATVGIGETCSGMVDKKPNGGDMTIHTLKRFRYTGFSTCDHGMRVNSLSGYIGLLHRMLRLGWSDVIEVGGRGLDRRHVIRRHMCIGVDRSGGLYSIGYIGLRCRMTPNEEAHLPWDAQDVYAT